MSDHIVELQSILRCPICRHDEIETMPENACVWIYTCKNCGQSLKPKSGDCCVFCSYGSVACPPMQIENSARARRPG